MADKSPSGDIQNDTPQKIKRIVWLFASAWSTQAILVFLSLFLLASFTKAGEMPATCDAGSGNVWPAAYARGSSLTGIFSRFYQSVV